MVRKEHDTAVQMLRNNVPICQISKATGYTSNYIQILKKKYGINHVKITVSSFDDLIMRMAAQGKSCEEIGKEIGYSGVTIKNYLQAKRHEVKQLPEEIEFPEETLTFAERKPIRIFPVEYGGKSYIDVTDIYCPG